MHSHNKKNTQNKIFQKLIFMGLFLSGITVSSVFSAESYSQKLKNGLPASQHHIVREANKGHIPSKIILLEKDAEKISMKRENIEKKKKILIKNLHNNDTLIGVNSLVDLEKKISAYDEQIFEISSSINELEMCRNSKTSAKSMFSSNNSDYFFVDESEEFEDDGAVVTIPKPKPKLRDILNDKLQSIEWFFGWRLETNKEILIKLKTLYAYARSDSKTILDNLIKIVGKEILLNEAKISKDRAYLSKKPKNNKENKEKIVYCDEILNYDTYLGDDQFKYEITPIILGYIKTLAKPSNFLSAAHSQFLGKALEVIDKIIKFESNSAEYQEYSNHQKLSICQEFLKSHDKAIQSTNIPFSQRLEMAMATLHVASKQLKKVNVKYIDCEDSIYNDYYILNNSVLSVEGKYVSWYLNQSYASYGNLLLKGARINHALLNFCDFSKMIQEMIGECHYYGIIDGLIDSNLFQLPISQSNQFIFIHKTAPYVFRLKNDGVHTIGLIGYSYRIDTDPNSFFPSWDNAVGNCYYADTRFGYPAITNQDNELLKFTFYRSCQKGALTSHGGLVPANNKYHFYGWKPYTDSSGRNLMNWDATVRKNLLDDAHFQIQ